MNSREFKAKLALLGLNQTTYAAAVGLSVSAINKMLASNRIKKIHLLAIEALEKREIEQC